MFYLGAVFEDLGSLAVVEPSVVKHEGHVVNEVPGPGVLPLLQLAPDRRQVHRTLHDVKVILQRIDMRRCVSRGEHRGPFAPPHAQSCPINMRKPFYKNAQTVSQKYAIVS